MKDVGKAAVAVTLLCFFTQIEHLLGARRQNAIQEFRTYHQTRPVLYMGKHKRSTTLTQKGHLPDATVDLTVFDQVLTLDLVLNRHLLPANYTEKYFLPDGSTVLNTHKNLTLSNCYYHGDVRGSTDSAVAVSTCNGLSGYIRDGGEVFYIEPVEGVLTGRHYVYRATDRIPSNTTGILDNVAVSPTLGKIQIKSSRKKRSVRWPYDHDSNTRIVELYIVNDHEQYVNNHRDISETIRRTKDIINVVSSLYRAADIYVALVGIEIWTVKNQIEVVDDATDTMNNFQEYRRTNICPNHRNDNAQMITGHTFLNGVVGKATIGGICTYQYSGGVDMDHSSLAVVAGTTVTHEMGHNFGQKHDGVGCDCPLRRCIMSPSSGGSEAVTWSSCSTEQFADAFHQGFDYCLRNLPSELYGDAYCGNGFLETGEECDCGLAKDCDTKCCDPVTCKLTVNATCATGECCDLSTCQLKSTTTPCRPAKNSCDLPEFCNGTVEFCPSDIFLENGVSCKNDVSEAYCYEGECHSHGSQCHLLWGKTGGNSQDLCYTHYNTHGAAYGNCGFNWTNKTFKKCAKKDAMCGMLHCTHRNEKLMFWSGQMSYTLPSNWLQVDGEKVRCNSAILDVGLDMSDPGMVPNGAKCGDDMLCVNHECVPVASLQHPVCPDCHALGVCNSLSQCHCQVGYAPPYCDHPGNGGSLHSGPIKIYKSSRGLLVGLLVFFLLILPLLAVAVFCGYRHRGHLKKVWREGATRHYRERAGGIWSVCRNVPSCGVIWKRSAKRTPSTRQQPMELGRAASFRPEDISRPRNLNSTNRTVGDMTPGGRHMTPGAHHYAADHYDDTVQVNAGGCGVGSYGNSSHDDKPLPTRTAPPAPKPIRPAPVVPPQALVPVVPPPRPGAGPSSSDTDHEYVNKPARPPPPRQQATPTAMYPRQQATPIAAFTRQPVASPRTPLPGNQWQPSHGCDSAPMTEDREEGESEAERRERFQQTRNAFQAQQPAAKKPAVAVKPTVSRSESQTSKAGRSRPLEKPPPPPQSMKPTFNK